MLDNISHLQQDIGSGAQSGSSHNVYYRLIAHTHNGEKIPLADSLPGSRLADFVEARIRAVLWPEYALQPCGATAQYHLGAV